MMRYYNIFSNSYGFSEVFILDIKSWKSMLKDFRYWCLLIHIRYDIEKVNSSMIGIHWWFTLLLIDFLWTTYLKMSRFPHIELWPFFGPLVFSMFLSHNEFWSFWGPPSSLTFRNVNNDGQSIFWRSGGETTEKKDKREQNNIVRVFWWKRRPPKAGDVFTKIRLMPV